ncbi:MAG: hypothetical protein LQ337_002792 [Flavoplaca oasis]|nr:MAG: hypothetical protein LQ337_002792 [Flavoplaca oasis]
MLGSFQLVGLLQRMGVDPHHSVYAARRNYDMIEVLLKHGAKIAADRKNGCTITRTAAEGNIKILRLLLSFADEKDLNRAAAALYWAAEKGYTDIVDLLLEHGLDINANCGPCGRTALFGACKSEVLGLRQGEEPSLDLVKTLLSKGADMSYKDDWGDTILHAVAGPTSTPELISTLLSAGASTSTRALHHGSFDGGIPLHSFAERLSTATSEDQPLTIVSRLLTNFFLILSHTDDVNIQDSNGQTPLHFLCSCDFGPTPLVVEGRLQAARLLITRGADTRLRDSKGRTPGDFMCRHGQGLDTIQAKLAGMHAHRYCFMLLLPG